MSSESQEFQLDEICDFVNGFAFKPENYIEKSAETYEVFRMGYIGRGGGFKEDSSPVFVSRSNPKLDKYRLRRGDIVIAMTDMKDKVAILGNTARVPQDDRFVLNQRAGLIRVSKPDIVCPIFLYYYSNWKPHVDYLRARANSGVQVNLSTGAIKEAKLLLPPLAEQRQIGSLLSSLDDRITLLRETNATLEAIAQALFKSWFVDFDPVRAKQQGLDPEGMSDATAALFPDGFEESELGPVPRGWRVGTVEDLCSTITNGGTPSRSKTELWEGGNVPWFKTGEFNDGFLLQSSERITPKALEVSAAKLLPENSVLMAIYAAPTVGRLGVLTEPSTFNQACTGMVAKGAVGTWFLFWTLYFGRDWFNSRANGAAQQNISKAIVSGYRVVIPSDSVLLAFNEVAASVHNRIRGNSEQAQTLATLRDTLLPRLISGQLRLPDVDGHRSR